MSVTLARLGKTAACIFGLAVTLSPWVSSAQSSMGFSFDITLSEKAASRLRSSGEGITIGASYYGDPKKGAEKQADEMGQIQLGYERFDVAGKPGTVRVTGSKFEAAKMKWVASPVLVNVNVFSARKKGPDNILSCDFIDTEVRALAGKSITLHCALITENVETRTRP